ncbi:MULTISPECIES: phosphate ABC transporter substrate-binding protein [Pseudoalteromonas]|uniref:phosphate ABC transporter substrate-binding protein n=1 Tax=Pseudoalteromonas TaxID=53246 RepID=UPI000FFE7120|nr:MULTISPECIES: phosphate ABC transporter substrate-binding protein [Pseudoalteromonas]MCG9760671.1 phosphate ABC transporter substrate-binding protein [Pseudoalteromonas sp. Isolate6]NKC19810.1 phosphate ABC transporter substrate-binding protein [Pseudoalteromonas galatheae]RXE89092.1 phosphate ABC transporter substrate-binding protein [Pseudoalteromonas sp. A757]
MIKKILSLGLLLASQVALADIAVIVNSANASAVDDGTIKKLFLGKSKSFADGNSATPVNQDGNAVFDEFNDKVIGKSSSQLNAHWSKLVFTGKGTPPKKLDSDQAVIDFVSSNADAIGYIDASKVTDAVKVIGKY